MNTIHLLNTSALTLDLVHNVTFDFLIKNVCTFPVFLILLFSYFFLNRFTFQPFTQNLCLIEKVRLFISCLKTICKFIFYLYVYHQFFCVFSLPFLYRIITQFDNYYKVLFFKYGNLLYSTFSLGRYYEMQVSLFLHKIPTLFSHVRAAIIPTCFSHPI